MMHQLWKNLRRQTKQLQVQRQNHQPLLIPLLKHLLQLQVPVGKRISSLSLQTLFQALTKILLRRTNNTGPRFVPDLATTTDFKTGTISASQPSTPAASANNWAGSSLINSLSSKSTCRLVSFCETQKPEPYNTITHLPTIIWCSNSRFWSPIKMIKSGCMTKSVTSISWSGLASKGPAVNGWWIWLQKSTIIPSAEENTCLGTL